MTKLHDCCHFDRSDPPIVIGGKRSGEVSVFVVDTRSLDSLARARSLEMTEKSDMVYFFSALLGLTVGSFLNAAVFRIRFPHQGSLVRERSHCPRCHTTLPWHDLIPLVSFFWLRRRCRFCHKTISWQYPIVELITALLFIAATIHGLRITDYGLPVTSYQLLVPKLLLAWFETAVLLFLFVFDFKYGLLPDRVTIPATVIVFFASSLLHFFHQLPVTSYQLFVTSYGSWSWLAAYAGAVAVGTLFFAVQYLFSHGRWVGAGDIRMGALVGAISGWPGVLVALAASYIIGAFTALVLLALGKKKLRGDTLPMGPFLAIGALIIMFFGDRIIEAVLYPYRFL